MELQTLLGGKTILITGGTGFLGRALISRILQYNPHAIRIFSRDEVKHHKVSQLFTNNEKLRYLIGDVRDYQRLESAMKGVDYVIHAAALKRLDIIEYNTEESVKTNILGTLNVVKAAEKCGIKKMIFVSTDKACSPANTYGGCKFVAERIVTEHNFSNGNSESIFCSVRYGNVVNSTGSIVPFLLDRIKKGLDFPLTDERMTRFLITEEQAVELIMKAFIYGVGGEVFIPQLPTAKIVDLMEAIKKINNTENKVRTIGIRPGEKIHEYMISDVEAPRVIEYDDMYVIPSLIDNFKTNYYKDTYIPKANAVNIESYSSEHDTVSQDFLINNFASYLTI